MPDFTFTNHGSITTLRPNTPAASAWVDENIPADAMQWAGAVVIEPRYADPILDGIASDGLTIE